MSPSRLSLRCSAVVSAVVVAVTGLFALPPAAAVGPTASAYPRLAVGSWNTDLQPWFSNRTAVIDTIAGTNLDVLALQSVFSADAATAVVSDPRVAAKYPYSFFAPAMPEAGSCGAFVPIGTQEDYIRSLVDNGVDTRTVEQPVAGVPYATRLLGLDLALTSQPCFEAIVNTMQGFAPGASPYTAIDKASDGTGERYSHGGFPGQLVLSRLPLQDVAVTPFDTFLIKRVNVYASVAGVRLAFLDLPRNVLGQFDPVFAPLQSGALQPDLARDVIAQGPDVVVGSLNSGPGYQPEAYDLLRGNGYTPLVSAPTYCPTTSHAAYAPCRFRIRDTVALDADLRLDNVLARTATTVCTPATTFATTPSSDHLGVASVCRKAPAFAATATLDAFDRADGRVGPAWDGLTGTDSYRIAGQKLQVQAGGPLVWKSTGFGPTQEAFVRLSTIAANAPSQGVLLKVQAGSTADAGAIGVTYDAKAKVVRLATLRVGARTWTGYPAVPAVFAAGDVLGARTYADGTVDLYRDGALLSSTTLTSSDAAFFAGKGGRIGIWTLASARTVLDDFGGGTVG